MGDGLGGSKQRHTYTAMRETDSWWGAAAQHRELSSGLCDDLEGRDEGLGGRLKRKGYMYTYS